MRRLGADSSCSYSGRSVRHATRVRNATSTSRTERVKRYRSDKTANQADTFEMVRSLGPK